MVEAKPKTWRGGKRVIYSKSFLKLHQYKYRQRRGGKYRVQDKKKINLSNFLYYLDWPNSLKPNPNPTSRTLFPFLSSLTWSVRQRTLICICCVLITSVMLQTISLHIFASPYFFTSKRRVMENRNNNHHLNY